MNFNKVILVGRLSKDCTLKYASNGTAITEMSLAVNRKYKKDEGYQDEVSFFDIVVFGKSAENCNQYLSKGSSVLIEGRLRQSVWKNDEGQTRSKVEVVADNVQFLSKPKEVAEAPGTGNENVFNDEEVSF